MTSSLELTPTDTLTSALVLHQWADMVISEVENQSDERLIDLARDANSLEKSAFRVRGACAAELKRRLEKLQVKSIGKEMSRLAKEIGVGAKTLEDDARIYQTFSDYLSTDTELDREHFRQSLGAPDPKAAIELALEQKIANSSYSTRDFREDVKRLQGGEQADEVSKGRWIHAKLDEGGADALDYLQQHLSKPPAAIVNQLLVERAEYSREKK